VDLRAVIDILAGQLGGNDLSRVGRRRTLRGSCPKASPLIPSAYGGDFDQQDAGQGSRVYLAVLVEDALVFFGDPYALLATVS
jgi:acetamidase/formamidase